MSRSRARATAAQRRPRIDLRPGLLAAALVGPVDGVPAEPAAVVVVTQCEDSGPGSLRDALASATEGAVIDLAHLACSTITLTTGALTTALDELSLVGPGPQMLRIDTAGPQRLLTHSGHGTLAVSGITFAQGRVESSDVARGGCLYSNGDADLASVVVSDCSVAVVSTGYPYPRATGGGIYVHGSASLRDSRVSGNTASARGNALSYNYGRGAGIYARGPLTLSTCSIVGNSVISDPALIYSPYDSGGGAFARSAVSIDSSTLSGNYAYFGGALASYSGAVSSRIANSTISGNKARFRTGGLAMFGHTLLVSNSTIAFNLALDSGFSGGPTGAGLLVDQADVTIRSSIIALNTAGDDADDLCNNNGHATLGAHDLIGASAFDVPGDTIGGDPLLLPLADNGGATWTHALDSHSPALDGGDNVEGAAFDQRGAGYPRTSGPRTDIGAFESPQPDLLFANGFDASPG